MKPSAMRQASRLPLDPAEKDTYFVVATEAEETTSKAGKPYFKIGLAFFNEDGTPAQKRDGSGEGVTLTYSTYEGWPTWDAALNAFFPEGVISGKMLDLPGDFYERWAQATIKIEEDKTGKFPAKLVFADFVAIPDDYLDVIESVSIAMNGKPSPTIVAIRGAKPAPKPALKPAPKPAAAAAPAKPATAASKPLSAPKPAVAAKLPVKMAPKPQPVTVASDVEDPDAPFGDPE